MPSPQIGSTVRITTTHTNKTVHHGVNGKIQSISRRGMIATLADGDDRNRMCTLILEDLMPAPLFGKFLISPILSDNQTDQCEIEVPISEIKPLLSFELSTEESLSSLSSDKVSRYKECGDELFKLHDYSRAISYYEAALHIISSNVADIGATLVVKRNGHCVIAELDCIETDGDNTQCDVTFILPDGDTEEDAISSKDILISVWDQDGSRRGQRDKPKEKYLQPRILLNLCRCLLHLADAGIATKNNRSQQTNLKKAAVLGSSIAITLVKYYNNESELESPILSSLLEKAQLIRSKAFLALGKLQNALVDVKKVTKRNPNNQEAIKLLREIKTMEKLKKKADIKLSKEVCKWVQSATGDL